MGSRTTRLLMFWVFAAIVIQAIPWIVGLRDRTIEEAIAQGEARIEARLVSDAADPDELRTSLLVQRQTRPFWRTLILIGDLVAEPSAIVLRPLVVAWILTALAAYRGRGGGDDEVVWKSVVAWQGVWVVGLAVRAGLMVTLRRVDVETSATLLLSVGQVDAVIWVGLRQLEGFAILGWLGILLSTWRAGRVGPWTALGLVVGLATVEAALRVGLQLVIEAGLRTTLEELILSLNER